MNSQSIINLFLLLTNLLVLAGCVSIPTSIQRQHTIDQLASQHGWQATIISGHKFDLMTYAPPSDHSNILTVYIEGDGFAWQTRTRPSTDPTPINPMGFKLALNHPSANVAYLARPCQYVGGHAAKGCNSDLWTTHRFSEDVVAASNDALDILKTHAAATQLQLVGYSGGGAIAALLTARRNDVIKLITVAGNLDHQAWTTFHKITPLTDSLNPADYQKQLANIQQTHFIGNKDKVIPPLLTHQFVAGLASNAKADVIKLPNHSHHCCWPEIWAELMLKQ